MAVCRPNANPRLIRWTETFNPASLLLQVTKDANAQMIAEGKRPTMAMDWDRVADWYHSMRTLDLPELIEALVDKRIIQRSETGIGGVAPMQEIDMNEAMVALSGLKVIFQGQAAALQDLSDVYLRKLESGENALEAGRMFGEQSHNLNAIASTILDLDRKYGAGMALQNHKQSIAAQEFFGGNANKTAALETASKDILERSRELINSGDRTARAEGEKLLGKYARIVRAVGSPERVIDLETQRRNVGDLIWTVAVNGLLSKPATFITNLAGGTYAFARPAFQILGALPTAATGVGPGGRAEAMKTVKLAVASLQGMNEGFRDGLTLAWNAITTGRALYDQNIDWGGLKGEQMEAAQKLALNGGWNPDNFRALGMNINEGDTAWGAIHMLGAVVAGPGRLMQGGDEMIKHLVWRGQLRAKGVKEAMAEGLDLSNKEVMAAKFAQVQELMFDTGNPDMSKRWQVDKEWQLKMRVEGSDAQLQESEVLRSTFQEESEMANIIYKLVQQPYIGPLVRPFMPFIKTPVNILRQGILDSTPLGAALKTGEVTIGQHGFNVLRYQQAIIDEASKNPAAYYQYLGQATFGTVLLGTVYTMAMNGQISGGGPQRWASGDPLKQQMHATWLGGIRAQGFSDVYQIRVGDTILPMSQLGEPFNTIAKIAIDIAEGSAYMRAEEQDNLMAFAVGMAVSGLTNASFLTGVNTLMDTLVTPDNAGGKFTKAAQQAAKVYTPFGALANYVDTIQDPYREAPSGSGVTPIWGDGGTWDQVFGAFMAPIRARIPGMSENLPVAHDPIFGQPVPITPGVGTSGSDFLQLTVPFMPRGLADADPVWEKVHQAAPNFRAPMPEGAPELTQFEIQKLNQRAATFRIGGKTMGQAIGEYLSRPEVEEVLAPLGTSHLVDKAVKAQVTKIAKDYRNAIYIEMLQEDPYLLERDAKTKKLRELEKDPGNAEAVSEASAQLKQLRQLASREQRGIPRPLGTPVIPSP